LTGKIHTDTKFRYNQDIQDGHSNFLPKIHFPPASFLSKQISQFGKKNGESPPVATAQETRGDSPLAAPIKPLII
jgi:hypothetical protein